MPETVTLRDRDGRAYGVPEEQVASYVRQGFRPETDEEGAGRVTADTFHEEYGGAGGTVGSGLLGGLSGLTLGGSDIALGALGGGRALGHLEGEHPIAAGVGQMAGALLPTVLTGGAAAPEEAAGIGARILAHSPAAMAGRVGGAIGGLGEGAGLVGRLAAGTAGAAAEGALYGGGQYLTETALEDKPLSAEGFVAGMGHGALFAAPIGAAGTLAGATLQRARSLFPRSEVSAAAAAGVKGEATSAIGQAVRDGDAMAQAAERKLSDVDAKAQIAQAGETVTRRVFGEAHPQALADQVAGAVDRQQVTQALEGYQQARQGVEDWIASEADPELEQALQGNKKFRAAFEKLGPGQPALDKMLGSAGPDDLETLLGQVGGRAPGDPQLDSAMRRLVDIPDAAGAGGVPAGEFGAPGKGGFKSQDELARLASGTDAEAAAREVRDLTAGRAARSEEGTAVLAKGTQPRAMGEVAAERAPVPIEPPAAAGGERPSSLASSAPAPLEIRRVGRGRDASFEAKLPDGSTRTLADRGEVAALAESELPQGWHLGNRFIETHRDLAIEHGLPKDAAGIRDNALYVARPSELADHGVIGGDLDAGRAERVAEARRTDIRLDPIEIKVDAGGRYWLDDGNHRLQEAAKSDAPVAIKFTPVKEFEWKGGSVDISERIRADLPVGARSAAPATDTLTGQLRGMQSKLGAGESLVEMGEPAREAYRAARAERTTDAAEHYRGKALAAREARAEVDESGFPIGFTREGGEWSGHRIFMDSDPVRRVNSASELPGFDSPEVTGKTRYAWVARPSDLATRKLVARGAASEESISAIGAKWDSGGQARPVIIHMEQAPKGMKGSRPPDQYYIHSGLDTLMAAARDGDRPVAIQFDRMNGYSAKGSLSEDVLAATKRGPRVPQGAEDLRVPAYNRYDQQLVDLAIKHGAKNLAELAAKPAAAAELRAIEDAYEATAARSPASTAHASTPSAPEPPALSIRRPEIAHDQALERPATDTLTGRLRGMQGKLDAGEGLAEMGRAPAAATRAEQKARAAEAAEHFRGEALAAREARAARHGLGDPAAPWNEGVPMAGAVETHDAPDPAFFARLTAPKTRDAYVAANIGRAMREEGSHAAALAKVEREWAERGGASASASADPLARFGLESDPSRLGGAASDVPAEVRAMALPERTAVDTGIKARMGGLRDEAAIAKAIMRHNGKGADMGPALARAAKAIGDMEDASARLTDVLGAEAPATAVENAKAYREALRGQQDRAAASAAKTAADLKTKVQPAADATIVDDDVTKALRQHDARVTAQASKSAPAAAPATGAAPSSAPAAAAATGASVGGRLADVGSALEVLSAIGAHVPVLSHIPVIGPILGLWLKARAVLGILGRKGGSIGKSTEGLIASKSAATRDRLVAATGALLEGGARAAGKVAHLAGPAVLLADALFPGGDKPASDKPRDLFEARTDDIVRAQQPGAIDQAIAQRYPTSDPAMHDAIVAQVQRGIAFLDGKRPKQTVLPGVLPGDGTWKPSTAAIDEFGKYVHAVNDPVSVFEDLAKGHPSAEGAETLRVVYPELYRLAQKELLQAAPAMATTLPYSRRVMISILYQIPVDGTMQPSHAQYLQAPAPPSAAPRAPATAGPLKLGQQTMSPLDQRASGA